MKVHGLFGWKTQWIRAKVRMSLMCLRALLRPEQMGTLSDT